MPTHKPGNAGLTKDQVDTLVALHTQGRFREIVEHGKTLSEKHPNVPFIPNLLGVAYARLGRTSESVASYRKALEIKPDYAEAHCNLGLVLANLGKQTEAITCYHRALEVRPDLVMAHIHLGIALNKMGKSAEAVATYHSALEIEPDNAEMHNNLGIALKNIGRYQEAIVTYHRALEIKTDYPEAHCNLGIALHKLGKHEEAIVQIQTAIELQPDVEYYWKSILEIFKSVVFKEYDENIARLFIELIDERHYVNTTEIAIPIIKLLEHNSNLKKAFNIFQSNKIELGFAKICETLSQIPLLTTFLRFSAMPDVNFEKLFTELRKQILKHLEQVHNDVGVLKLQSTLANHCFTNEFVFIETREESDAIAALEEKIEESVGSHHAIEPLEIACLASYRPLHIYAWARTLEVPGTLKDLFQTQVSDVLVEQRLQTKIQCLKPVTDQISKIVRAQYEENPYPRWVSIKLSSKSFSIPAVIRMLDLNLSNIESEFTDTPEILVAGCGTGRHPLSTASRFSNCKVLAVDLSINSLSYAVRKTRELGFSNVEYMQADILDLQDLGRQFDIVESAGVLHHMADPSAGWQTLVECLKPGGLMKIGLYSKLARQHIAQARDMIARQGITSSAQDIRNFRQSILNSGGDEFADAGKILKSMSFYYLSGCRDLLFNVQEHQFTIPQIKSMLEEFDLDFLGFEFVNASTIDDFRQSYAERDAQYSLDRWHEFEIANPSTFAGMYQFWVRKTA